jgi:hypothetical protein
MYAPSTRIRRIVPLAIVPLAIVAAGLMVWQGSSAAFTAQTRNAGNNWQTGSVTLTDDDAGAARFGVDKLTPMASDTKCITVTSTSSVPGVVKLYVDGLNAKGLQDQLHVVITKGNGGSFGSCTGFVADAASLDDHTLTTLAAEHTDYASGALPWATAGVASGESKTYQIAWTFDTSALTQTQIDALQGKSAGVNFVWELQSS